MIIASAAAGFAGALFNPAVRAYLAQDSGERRVEAFALFSVFYQTGILIGPLIGLALTGVSFQLTCLVAAAVFGVLTVLQLTSLPQQSGKDTDSDGPRSSVLAQWRGVLANRPFLLFSVAMTGSYVMSFQIYLALPLEARRIVGEGPTSTIAVAALFAVSALVTIVGQLRITSWCKRRWRPGFSMALGLTVMGVAFLPPLAAARQDIAPGDTPAQIAQLSLLVLSAGLLALGTSIAFPFEMDTVVALAQDRLVATHYGFYNTVCGIGILLGNLGTGSALGAGRSAGLPELPWVALGVVGLLCAAGIRALDSRELLPASQAITVPRRGRHRRRRGSAYGVDAVREPIAASPDHYEPGADGRLSAGAEPTGSLRPEWPPSIDGEHTTRSVGNLSARTPAGVGRRRSDSWPSAPPPSGRTPLAARSGDRRGDPR